MNTEDSPTAEHNKDGWRVAAIEATDKAIGETERGRAMAPCACPEAEPDCGRVT